MNRIPFGDIYCKTTDSNSGNFLLWTAVENNTGLSIVNINVNEIYFIKIKNISLKFLFKKYIVTVYLTL